MTPKRSFSDTIYLLFIFGKVFGLSCYGVTKGSVKFKVSFNVSHFVQFLAFLGIILTLLYLNLQVGFNTDENNTQIFNKTQKIQMVASLFCVLGGYFQVLLMRQHFWDLVNTIQAIDRQVNRTCLSKVKFYSSFTSMFLSLTRSPNC